MGVGATAVAIETMNKFTIADAPEDHEQEILGTNYLILKSNHSLR
jgi:hypothetical protein